mmetsp:Transcript_10078/g.25820  ORF Transcript_10078/g.25820 Transcript_10078/m.25820 type:complete len:207 (-) Transcript_10078:472-1092(-)
MERWVPSGQPICFYLFPQELHIPLLSREEATNLCLAHAEGRRAPTAARGVDGHLSLVVVQHNEEHAAALAEQPRGGGDVAFAGRGGHRLQRTTIVHHVERPSLLEGAGLHQLRGDLEHVGLQHVQRHGLAAASADLAVPYGRRVAVVARALRSCLEHATGSGSLEFRCKLETGARNPSATTLTEDCAIVELLEAHALLGFQLEDGA